jgi:hypothetical protein
MGWKTAQRLLDEGALAGYSHAESHILFVAAMDENAAAGYFASDRTLAKRSHSNRRTVKATMAKAEQFGLLVDTGEKTRSTVVYRFTIGAPTCATETPTSGAPTCATEAATNGAVSTPRMAQSEHATGALSLACKESVESITTNRGSRAHARGPRDSDIGLTPEEIAEKNHLDLDWKRRKQRTADRSERGLAVIKRLTAPTWTCPHNLCDGNGLISDEETRTDKPCPCREAMIADSQSRRIIQ